MTSKLLSYRTFLALDAGWRTRFLAGHDMRWALEYMDARDAHAFTLLRLCADVSVTRLLV